MCMASVAVLIVAAPPARAADGEEKKSRWQVTGRAGADALAFAPLKSKTTGAQTSLDYHIRPIVLARVEGLVAYDFDETMSRLARKVLRVGLGYSGDRVYRSGGTVNDNPELARAIGFSGAASDVFNALLAFHAFEARGVTAKFTDGTVRYVTPAATSDPAPFQFSYTRVDVGFRRSFGLDLFQDSRVPPPLFVGFRYFDFTLPRIVTETRGKAQLVLRESPPQPVRTRVYQVGAELDRHATPSWNPVRWHGGIGVFLGAGPSKWYWAVDPTAADTPANREYQSQTWFAVTYSAVLGFEYIVVGTPIRVADPGHVSVALAADGNLNGVIAVGSAKSGDAAVSAGGMSVIAGGRASAVVRF